MRCCCLHILMACFGERRNWTNVNWTVFVKLQPIAPMKNVSGNPMYDLVEGNVRFSWRKCT